MGIKELKSVEYDEVIETQIISYVTLEDGSKFEFEIASYLYNHELNEEETAPTIMCSSEFEELPEKLQESIIKTVNCNVRKHFEK